MTLPVELLQRRGGPERYDAVVVGGGVAGLVGAAILARAGARVVLVERGKRPGGQMQTLAHQGYAIDVGPFFWEGLGFQDALRAAGAGEVALGTLHPRDALRVVVAREGGSTFDPVSLPVPGGTTSPSTLAAVRSLYGVPPRVFAALGEIYQELVQASPELLEEWRATTLEAWLVERAPEPVVAAALRRSAALFGALDPRRASLAHLTRYARWLSQQRTPGFLVAGDGPVLGTRGVVQALVDACIDAGVELRLGTRATGMALDRGRFVQLEVRREEQLFADAVLAEHAVLAVPRTALAGVLPGDVRRALDASFPPPPCWSAVGAAWALREVPEVRGGGSAADAALFRLIAPAEASGPGTFASPVTLFWPSVTAPRVAPPGRALLLAQVALPDGATTDARQVGGVLTLLRTYVRQIYPALDEVLEWERHWVETAGPPDPFVSPVLPGAAPGCTGVHLAGADVASPGAISTGVAAAVASGRAAAERILAR